MTLEQAPATEESRGLELIGYHDLNRNPAFKLAMQKVDDRYYVYLSHFWNSGWSAVDVTDPANPVLTDTVPGEPTSVTYQVAVADGLMIGSYENPNPGWGYEPGAGKKAGIVLFDVKTDPAHPKLLSYHETAGRGTHRNFYAGGKYAYLADAKEGYRSHILSVVDVSDPTNVREVGTWHAPGQKPDDGAEPILRGLHGPAYVRGNRAYLGYGQAGGIILDVSDPTNPTFVSRVRLGDFGSSLGAHTFLPYSDTFAVISSEALDEGDSEGLPYAVGVDISDEEHPRIVSWFPTPFPAPETGWRTYQDKGGRHGPHNQHQWQGAPGTLNDPNRVYIAHFNGGLRVYDISEHLRPAEIAYYVPVGPTERLGAKPINLTTSFEDVIVDDRGNIFCTDKNYGLFALRLTDEAKRLD